jgi:ABC-type nitrate/sulfonate/bicarbonate transport system substrate-binding protein
MHNADPGWSLRTQLNRRSVVAGGVAAIAASGIAGPARAAEVLRVVAFAGASNWPFWACQQEGFFRDQDVEVTLEFTPNSVELARNMMAGNYDLALAAFDNVVAYDEGQGEVDLGAPADFVALFGVDNGMLSVMASPDISGIKALKGHTVSVDALTTGFAFVLREVLARNDMSEGDVTLARAGGGAQRLEALLKNEHKATLLNTPLDLVAEARGYKPLLRVRDMLGAYQGIMAWCRRGAVTKKGEALRRFTRAFHTGVQWIAAPANKDKAILLLMSRMSGMTQPAAEKAYVRLLDPADGIYRDLRIDRAGLKAVLDLRSKYAQPRKQLTDAERYVDASFLAGALK